MFRWITKLLLILTLLTLPELLTTTGKFFLGIDFPLDMLLGVLAGLASAFVFLWLGEHGKRIGAPITGLLAMLNSLGLLHGTAGVPYFSILVSAGAFMLSCSILMLLMIIFPFGVLLGKLDHNPLKLVT